MTEVDFGQSLQDGLRVMLVMGAPPLLAALAIGLLIALLQALTQINEATLVFVPKMVAVTLIMALMGTWMVRQLTEYATSLYDQVLTVGVS